MLVSTWIRTRGLPGKQKSEKFLSKALPLSHGGITLDGDKKSAKGISNQQNVTTKYRTCPT